MSLVLTLIPLLTAGQYGTIALTISDKTAVDVNASDCGGNLTGSYTTNFATTAVFCTSFQLWVTSGECADTANTTAGDLLLKEFSATSIPRGAATNIVQIPVSQLPYFKMNQADGGAMCGAGGLDITHKFCAATSVSTSYLVVGDCNMKSTIKATTPVTIHYDTKAPGKPSLTAEPLDSAAALTISVDSDTDSVEVQYRVQGDVDFVSAQDVSTSSLTTTINGLQNGVTYEIQVIAFDEANNPSAPSDIVTVTPVHSDGFWSACVNVGCNRGGCSMAPGSFALSMLALLVLFRRNRR